MFTKILICILWFIPKAHLSRLVGAAAYTKLPGPLAGWSVRLFAAFYRIDLGDAEKPVEEYQSVGEFFSRRVKPESRPIAPRLVCPVDGMLRSLGPVCNGVIPQVKDRDCSLPLLLGSDDEAARYSSGFYLNFYLSPSDYHHVHSPFAGKLIKTVYHPGKLWPVTEWSIRCIPNVLAGNERVLMYFDSDYGAAVVVMIAALNVGKISLSHIDLVTNDIKKSKSQRVIAHKGNPIDVSPGSYLGGFQLGSSVVVLFERSMASVVSDFPRQVRFGQGLEKV